MPDERDLEPRIVPFGDHVELLRERRLLWERIERADNEICELLGRHVCGPETDAYIDLAKARTEAVRTVVERYGRVWAKDTDYYLAAEALGIQEPPC